VVWAVRNLLAALEEVAVLKTVQLYWVVTPLPKIAVVVVVVILAGVLVELTTAMTQGEVAVLAISAQSVHLQPTGKQLRLLVPHGLEQQTLKIVLRQVVGRQVIRLVVVLPGLAVRYASQWTV
jgi:hypothetical protein